MDFRQYAAVIWKWLWLIVLGTAIAAVSTWMVAREQPPVYETAATLMIGQVVDRTDLNYLDFYTGERLAQTYSELIQREPVLKAAAAALGYEGDWRDLQSKVAVDLVPDTLLLEIKVTDADPQQARRIADEVAYQLVELVKPDESPDREFIRTQAATLPAKIEAAQQEIGDLEAQLAESFSARQIQDIEVQIQTLRNQINAWQATYAQYQLLLGESGLNVLEVIEEAPLPTTPAGSNWRMQVLLAAAIGGVLAVGTAFLLEYLDDTLKSPDDVTKTMGLTTLGAITRIAGDEPHQKLVAARYPRSPISEAYRVTRTNLHFSSLDEPLRSLVVTSPNPTEGKSTTLANLGVVMAQSGKSVVMVDSDLRRPMLHKIFQVPNHDGLTSVLLEDEPLLDGHLQETGVENLRLLTSGPLPPNPSELLGSLKMRRLIEQLEGQADVVLLDTPPALPVTDAAVLAAQAGGVLVVADAGRTRRAVARQAVDSLRNVGGNLLGVVLNRLSPRGRGSYYYYYYYYHSEDSKPGRRHRRRWYHRIPLIGRLFRR
jgi:succinoglycan biosynthesis transport protein ExoP